MNLPRQKGADNTTAKLMIGLFRDVRWKKLLNKRKLFEFILICGNFVVVFFSIGIY